MKKGNLSINSENILPIIKKWLYSDYDIFIRELVSNGCDAINKLKKLCTLGEASLKDNEKFSIKVVLDKENKTIQIIDNGIGMTEDEIEEYITQIAFSGANDFVNKYKDQIEGGTDMIGHFGLGFYSAFMVAEKVAIDTLSFKDGSSSARWVCDGGIDYEITKSDRTTRGTTITLHISEDGKDFLNAFKLREALNKYCYFMPIEIYFEDLEEIKKANDEKNNTKDDKDESIIDEKPNDVIEPINDISPLWIKPPNECTDEDYKKFYSQVFNDFNEPLFWIHLNMDYPFKLKGILYFPKLKHELESIEGQVKLYNNQVFIADNLKEVIPEFLLLLKGTLDCPDLPLNVSRSFLQNDGYVTKMSKYITKKVADKLNSLFKKERETFENFWDDISQFIKYGCLKEKDFYEKVKNSLLFKNIADKHITLSEYLEKNKQNHENKVFYITDKTQQAQYIKMFKENDMDAVILDTKLDNPYMSTLEMYNQGVSFVRIDADLSDSLKDSTKKDNKELNDKLSSLFKDNLKLDSLKIKTENLKTTDISGIIQLSEQSRRMEEMSKMYGMSLGNMPVEETLIVNLNNDVVSLLLKLADNQDKKEETKMVCEQIYDLAKMSHKHLDMNATTSFIERSNKILSLLLDKSL